MNCDLVIIGSGPAGMSAAINAASEGIKCVVCESSHRLGGQAGEASLIENLFGFPEGISGEELTKRSIEQACKFGVEFRVPFNVVRLEKLDRKWKVISDHDEEIICKCILLATGVSYRLHEAKNISRFMGNGVSYGSPLCTENFTNKTIAVVGGANSAGQAAVYLAQQENTNVWLIVRDESFRMSKYLVDKIHSYSNIYIKYNSQVSLVKGNSKMFAITVQENWLDLVPEVKDLPVDRMFILIGAKPKTSWLKNSGVELDIDGFIKTGSQSNKHAVRYMESTWGIFAAGDVRLGSVKRVASASGEGSRTINDINSYLKSWNNDNN